MRSRSSTGIWTGLLTPISDAPCQPRKSMPRTLVGAVGVGLLAAVAVLAMRASVESSSRDVEIALDGPDWEALARREGQDPLTFFARAREHGATAVAVYEPPLKRLAEQGEVAYAKIGRASCRERVE